jgi:hypothetical protein
MRTLPPTIISYVSATVAISLCFACSKDKMSTTDTPDTGTSMTIADSGIHPDAMTPPMDSGVTPDAGFAPDTGPVDDNNDSFAEAETVLINGEKVGHINPAGDFDYFSFEAAAGDWLVLYTTANPSSQPNRVDTVITLYDSNMVQLAENDDGIPRQSPDSEIIYHVPTTGTYFIMVQEFSTWKEGRTPEGAENYRYRIHVDKFVAENNDYITIDSEAGNDIATANNLTFYSRANSGYAMGTLASDSDIDVYRFTIPVGPDQNFRAQIMPAGVDGYGSTSGIGLIWITDVTGSTITARIDNGPQDLFRLSPPLAAGDYLMWVSHPGMATGSNDHYTIKNYLNNDNPPEMEDTNNDTREGAELVTMSDATLRSGFILTDMPFGDVDNLKFEVKTGEEVAVYCGSRSSGSGIQQLTATVTDMSGTMIGTGTETATSGISLSEMTITSTMGYVRLSRGEQDMEVTGQWVRCGIRAGIPD